MAANSNEYQAIAESETFQARVQIYMHKAAHAVYSEGGAVANHALRIALADKILAGESDKRLWAYSVMTNATLQTNGNVTDASGLNGISDSDLEFTINSVYNAFAGAEYFRC